MKHWLGIALLAWCGLATAASWRLALIGDVPYSPHQRAELPRMLAAIDAQHPDLIVHVGDIKSGQERCDDALFRDRHDLFNASTSAFLLVPGDNEWTDCDRLSAGAYDPTERLEALRRLFWATPVTLGTRKIGLERQSTAWPEHVRLRLGPVLLVSLNLPGGNNNFGMTDIPRAEFVARNPVVLDWLKDSFALARQDNLAGIVVLFQANPGFRHFSQGLAHRGYREFLELLRQETAHFDGQVLVVHGDTHIPRIDQPLRDTTGRTLRNFTRIETYGYPLMGWTRVLIDTESPRLFRFETMAWPAKSP